MSEAMRQGISRRAWLRRFASAVVVAGHCSFSPEAARRVHELARQETAEGGTYTPKYFKAHEFRTLQRLAELIIPADGTSGSAAEAGAPEFIDLLCSQNETLADLYSGGLIWLDVQMRQATERTFLAAGDPEQVEMLRRLDEEARRQEATPKGENAAVFRENTNFGGFRDYRTTAAAELGHGIRFFNWLRRMTVDAFYTSPMGIEDVGYRGNQFLNEYTIPPEVLEFVKEEED